jgi:hypothetical protein
VSESPIARAPDGIRAILGHAIGLYRARFLLYLALIAIPVVPVSVAIVVVASAARNPGSVTDKITSLDIAADFLLSMPLAQGFVAYVAAAQTTGRRVTLVEALRAVLPWFGILVGTVLLSSLVILFGLILLIVPGLVLALWFQFVGQVVVLEHLTLGDALRRCRALVRGTWWRTLRDVLVIGAAGGVVGLLVQTVLIELLTPADASDRAKLVVPLVANIPASVLVLPFSSIALTLVYLRLQRLHQ